VPTVFAEDRCDVCHESALTSDSDLVLCQVAEVARRRPWLASEAQVRTWAEPA
jgi:hypothetical protein